MDRKVPVIRGVEGMLCARKNKVNLWFPLAGLNFMVILSKNKSLKYGCKHCEKVKQPRYRPGVAQRIPGS